MTRAVHVPYTVEQDEDGVWCAHAQLRPGVGANGEGDTLDAAVADLHEALEGSLPVTILLGQVLRFAEQPLRLGEFPVRNAAPVNASSAPAELAGSPPRLGCHGRQRIPGR